MFTIFVQTFYESLHRRMGLVLVTISAVVGALQFWFFRFETHADGKVFVRVRDSVYAADSYARTNWQMMLTLSNDLWLFMAVFASAPLLVSFLEKGWAEMLFAKGVPRWQVLGGRYLASLALFVAALLLIDALPATYFWLRTGVSPLRFLAAAALSVFNFAVLLGLMTVAAVTTANAALPVLAAFLQVFLSTALSLNRKDLLEYFTSRWMDFLIEWTYRLLPKVHEVRQQSFAYMRGGAFDSWWPLWTSAAFLAAMLALAQFTLRRREF